MFTSKRLLPAALLLGGALCAGAQTGQKPTVTPYDFGDRCYISFLSSNGNWALTGGTADSGSTSRIVNLTDGSTHSLTDGAHASAISSDGKTAVGSYQGNAAVYSVDNERWENLPVPQGYVQTSADAITPDGRYAVGMAWKSLTEINGAIGLMWDLQTKQLIELPNLPKRSALNSEILGYKFNGVSDDGRYVLADVDWNQLLSADSGLFMKYSFVYDRQTSTWKAIGYDLEVNSNRSNTEAYVETSGGFELRDTGVDLGPWYIFKPQMESLYIIDGAVMSHNGKYVTGTGMFDDGEYSEEYPYLYNIADHTSTAYPDASGSMGTHVTDDGVVVAATPVSNPVRESLVRGNGYWFPLSTILHQKYGFDFYEETGYDNTGTANGMTIDGKRMAMMPDPYTSYILDLPESLFELTSGVQLLGAYTTDVPVNAKMSQVKSISITFNYEVESLTTSSGAQLINEDGTVKANSSGVFAEARTIRVTFARNNRLEEGKKYEVVIPAGAISIKHDSSQLSPEIRIPITGRANDAVAVTKIYPADNAMINGLDYSTNPIVVTYDSPVKLVSGVTPLLYREGESSAFCTLNVSVGNNEAYIFPPTSQSFFKDVKYRVEIPAGLVTDLSDNGASEAITLNYTGTYVREVPSDIDRLFFDDFSQGMNNFLLFDGDKLTPGEEMAGWQFTNELPWSLVSEDDYSNFAAASHSMYSPAGQSDDWMVIPRLHIQDKNCRLHFKAQSYETRKNDVLKVIVWENGEKLESLDAATVAKIKSEGVEVFSEKLTAQTPKGTMAGNWVDYSIPLEQFMGKDIYIAFWNNNDRQSAIFVDDVEVTRGLDFILSIDDTPTSVVNKESVQVKGFVVGNSTDKTYNKLTAVLKDAEGKKISEYEASGLNLKKGDRYEFAFAENLPLTVGETSAYSVSATLDDDNMEATGSISDLAFQPVKRVVLEEITGVGCGNCPKGHLAIERMHERFGTQFIPVAIHTYPGDPYSSRLTNYTDFLGLSGAPSGQINRSHGVLFPLISGIESEFVYFSTPDYVAAGGSAEGVTQSWEDLVTKELETPAEADIHATATYNSETKSFAVTADVKYAMNAQNRNVNLFAVMLEDHLINKQDNYCASSNDPAYGEWGQGGKYGQATVYDYEFFDVARGVLGVTYNGTGGLLPYNFNAGQTYTANLGDFAVSRFVENPENCRVVVMMIDAATGKIINAHVANTSDVGSVDGIVNDQTMNGPAIRLEGTSLYVQGEGDVKVSVHTLDGALVATRTIASGSAIDLKGNAGVVIVKATDNNGTATMKAMLR